jgi:hypothetical protein
MILLWRWRLTLTSILNIFVKKFHKFHTTGSGLLQS